MIELVDVAFAYGDHRVLDGVSAVLRPGTLTALFGPNGTGKSTLFRCMLGHLRHRGRVLVGGQTVASLPPERLARRMAYVPQAHDSPFPVRALEMVLLGRTPHLSGLTGPDPADVERSYAELHRLGLLDAADQAYSTLSGGQRQLVLIARALVQDTPVVLLDEPTSSLDFGNQVRVWRTVRRLADEGRTVVICTHDPNQVLAYADRMLALGRHGRLVAEGTPGDQLTGALIEQLYPGAGTVTSRPGRAVVVPT